MSAKGPSRTATKIARFMVLIDALPRLRGVLPPGAATAAEAVLLSSGAVAARSVSAMRSPVTLGLYTAFERALGRGQVLWFGLRKRWMADQVAAAVAAGARQVLVVGAGFDPLAVMVAGAHPEVLCVEVDAPPTAGPKRAGVVGAGLARPNHHVVAADLSTRPLVDALAGTPWRADVRSVVVAEGLLMYLAPAGVDAFLAAVAALVGGGSRLAFSSVDAHDDGGPRVGTLDGPIRFALRLAGEPMRFGLRPRDVPGFLASAGYRAVEQPTPDSLRAHYLRPLGLHDEPLLPYEHLVLAEIVARASPPA